MSTIGITTSGETMWVRDACGAPALTPNAFTLPRRRGGSGGRKK